VFNDPPVFPGRIDPSDRFRDRRRRARRRRQIRSLAILAVLVGAVVALALNAKLFTGGGSPESGQTPASSQEQTDAQTESGRPMQPPEEIRGVHVTAALASVPGKLGDYLALRKQGLNTLELDIKDENGEIGFRSRAVPLATEVGAAQRYYDPKAVAQAAQDAGVYLIGRVVVFEDPRLSEARPGTAIRTPDGSVWRNSAGLGWTNPYDQRVWKYNVDIAVAAARAGFDEIMFDYVRFPSDGDVDAAVYAGRRSEPRWQTISSFVEYATNRLKPLGVNVSAALFGLAATRDLGIGQRPRLLAKYLDTVYPMVYPSHFGSGEYDIPDPDAAPGRTVSFALLDYRRKLQGRDARIVPWLQDFTLGHPYTPADVKDQVEAARRAGTAGYLLWNAGGEYTRSALAGR
jgi:hypothetical protein